MIPRRCFKLDGEDGLKGVVFSFQEAKKLVDAHDRPPFSEMYFVRVVPAGCRGFRACKCVHHGPDNVSGWFA